CRYCGTTQAVRRDGGVVSLRPIRAAIEKVQRGTDRTALELAVRRLRDDLAGLEQKLQQARSTQAGKLIMGLVLFAVGLVLGMWKAQSITDYNNSALRALFGADKLTFMDFLMPTGLVAVSLLALGIFFTYQGCRVFGENEPELVN